MKSLWYRIPEDTPIKKYPFQLLFIFLLFILYVFGIPGGSFCASVGSIWLIVLISLFIIKNQKKVSKVSTKKFIFMYFLFFLFLLFFFFVFSTLWAFVCIFLKIHFVPGSYYGIFDLFSVSLCVLIIVISLFWLNNKFLEKFGISTDFFSVFGKQKQLRKNKDYP